MECRRVPLGQCVLGAVAVALSLTSCAAAPPGPARRRDASDDPSAYELNRALGEDVAFVTRRACGPGEQDAQLETTIYRPRTPPPWPLVVFNHGSNGRLPSHHLQPRERPGSVASFFLDRGYLVAVPMRQGFSRSTGTSEFRCDHAEYALRYAGDIGAVVDHVVQSGEARGDQVVIVGQSNGGLVTLGYGAKAPRARGLINVSGGVDTLRPGCDWREGMLRAAAILGGRTQIPSLWLYAADDPTFPPSISSPFFEAYRGAGARAALTLYPRGGHGFLFAPRGADIWGADVDRFLAELGLPSRP